MERDRLRSQPRPEWHVYVDESGARWAKTADLEDALAFDRWNVGACEHEGGEVLHHWLGNISGIGLIRAILSDHHERFPLILAKVVYSGSHGGDHIPVAEFPQLAGEMEALSSVRPAEPRAAERFRDFETKIGRVAGRCDVSREAHFVLAAVWCAYDPFADAMDLGRRGGGRVTARAGAKGCADI